MSALLLLHHVSLEDISWPANGAEVGGNGDSRADLRALSLLSKHVAGQAARELRRGCAYGLKAPWALIALCGAQSCLLADRHCLSEALMGTICYERLGKLPVTGGSRDLVSEKYEEAVWARSSSRMVKHTTFSPTMSRSASQSSRRSMLLIKQSSAPASSRY
jgi:hypothetical protein